MTVPDLTFPNVEFGSNETPWDFCIFLYRGGAKTRASDVARKISSGELGCRIESRISLVGKFHETVNNALEMGGSRESAKTILAHMKHFFGFIDEHDIPASLDTVEDTFYRWADELHLRTMKAKKGKAKKNENGRTELSKLSAYCYGATVAVILDKILAKPFSIMLNTKLEFPPRRKSAITPKAEKQRLDHTYRFGEMLLDICDALPLVVFKAPTPTVTVNFRNGKSRKFSNGKKCVSMQILPSIGHNFVFANIRIEAELHFFIAQTGMNKTPALNLSVNQFSYESYIDSYKVREYKARRNGDVLFEIFKEYRGHFERYLEWRRTLFPESTLLFPFIKEVGSNTANRCQGHRMRNLCAAIGEEYVAPQTLRNTRVNWLMRQTSDPEVLSDLNQHAQRTLFEVYEAPSEQRAIPQLIRFWRKNDPHAQAAEAAGPGMCDGTPNAVENIPKHATKPNCGTPSGCLWCDSHRDIESLEYVWQLLSLKHLKSLELDKRYFSNKEISGAPADLAIGRIDEKLKEIRSQGPTHSEWVTEATIRITEENFHPNFSLAINQMR